MASAIDTLSMRIAEKAQPVFGPSDAFEPLLEKVGDAHFVLLGESTHGTHEFYAARAAITQRLVEEKDFNAVAVEADWPDAYRVNRFIYGRGDDRSAAEALDDFTRFPRWMWRNTDIDNFVDWLRYHNRGKAEQDKVGFYGLDLYSLNHSIEAVIAYLDSVDPEAARRAIERYSCFDSFGDDPQRYGYEAGLGISTSCENEVIAQLVDLRQKAMTYLSRDGLVAEDEQFCAEQNARVAQNAERYYREMYKGAVSTWNLRDRHMADTLDALAQRLSSRRGGARVVVWAHNSHLGDARATEMAHRGEHNLGQLVRQSHFDDCRLVGFTTHRGTVAAATNWNAPVERKLVLPGREDSYEGLFHRIGMDAFHLDVDDVRHELRGPLLERAIGVIYRPETERISHYFTARMAQQFDTVIHFDHSNALIPLEPTSDWETADLPETYPFGE